MAFRDHKPKFHKQWTNNPWKYSTTKDYIYDKRIWGIITIIVIVVLSLWAYKFYLPHALSDIGNTKSVGQLNVTLNEVYRTADGVRLDVTIYNSGAYKQNMNYDLYLLNGNKPTATNLPSELFMIQTGNGTLDYSVIAKKYELDIKGTKFTWQAWQEKKL